MNFLSKGILLFLIFAITPPTQPVRRRKFAQIPQPDQGQQQLHTDHRHQQTHQKRRVPVNIRWNTELSSADTYMNGLLNLKGKLLLGTLNGYSPSHNTEDAQSDNDHSAMGMRGVNNVTGVVSPQRHELEDMEKEDDEDEEEEDNAEKDDKAKEESMNNDSDDSDNDDDDKDAVKEPPLIKNEPAPAKVKPAMSATQSPATAKETPAPASATATAVAAAVAAATAATATEKPNTPKEMAAATTAPEKALVATEKPVAANETATIAKGFATPANQVQATTVKGTPIVAKEKAPPPKDLQSVPKESPSMDNYEPEDFDEDEMEDVPPFVKSPVEEDTPNSEFSTVLLRIPATKPLISPHRLLRTTKMGSVFNPEIKVPLAKVPDIETITRIMGENNLLDTLIEARRSYNPLLEEIGLINERKDRIEIVKQDDDTNEMPHEAPSSADNYDVNIRRPETKSEHCYDPVRAARNRRKLLFGALNRARLKQKRCNRQSWLT